ncbi:phosphatase PAP2 family protein [Nonomuraea longispora]|uniref:Phosphatase PAP2 family protein n=1 Tax=Nonomuraea longispora TaxID=1848320 RepID=A0A4R4NKA6_9ACTN|nr:phosphatase PAP2 family protein [Nonomuraea longispora]TDC09565.1 phosphatase PAP2 family protein [Nonomuraea longispora]
MTARGWDTEGRVDFLDELHLAELGPIIGLQQWPEWVLPVMKLISALGTDTFYLLCLPLLYWCVNPALALRLGLTVMVAATTNALAKLAWHQPRPYWIDGRVRPLSLEGAFGLPSGHAQSGTAGLGRLAWLSGRPWAWWAAGGLVGLVCVSRVYLGVHFVSDVVTGVMFGLAVLALVVKLERPALVWWRRQALWAQLTASAALSFVLIGAAALINASYAGWSPPPAWSPAGAIDPENLDRVVILAGLLAGTLVGASVMHRIGWFDVGGPAGVRAARWLLGMLVAGAVFYVMRELLPQTGVVLYAGYALLALWVQLGAPVLFIRLGLMSPARQVQPVQ